MVDFISGLSAYYLYPGIFFGIILVGGVVLLPAMYLSLLDTVNIYYLFLIAILAGIVADALWYYIGKYAKKERLYNLSFVKKRIDEANRFSSFYVKHGVLLSFVTKFVYGTRIASHVLAGMHKIHFMKFLLATSLGTSIWFIVLYYLVRSVDNGIASVQSVAFRIELTFLTLFIIMLLFNWATGRYLKKKLEKKSKKAVFA